MSATVNELELANGVVLRVGQVWRNEYGDVTIESISPLGKCGSGICECRSPHVHATKYHGAYYYLTRWEDGMFTKMVSDPGAQEKAGGSASSPDEWEPAPSQPAPRASLPDGEYAIKMGSDSYLAYHRKGEVVRLVFKGGHADCGNPKHGHGTSLFNSGYGMRNILMQRKQAAPAAPSAAPKPAKRQRREVSPDGGRSWVDYDQMADPDAFEAYAHRRLDGVVVMVAQSVAAKQVHQCGGDNHRTGGRLFCLENATHPIERGQAWLCDEHYMELERRLVPESRRPERLAPGVKPGQPFQSHATLAGGIFDIRGR